MSRHKKDRGEKKKIAYISSQKTVYHHLYPLSKNKREDENISAANDQYLGEYVTPYLPSFYSSY